MGTKQISEQLYQAADNLLGQLWLRQTEALEFLNDFSLLLYGLDREPSGFFTQLKSLRRQSLPAWIRSRHEELGQLDYEFGRALARINENVWHALMECLEETACITQTEKPEARLFEYLLQSMYMKEKIGNFITPQTLADMMADMMDPKPGEIVADPVCGSGRLLAAAAKTCKDSVYIGNDIDEVIGTTAFFNMAFHSVTDVKLYRKDFLKETWKEQGDVVLANPPYSDDIYETIRFIEGIMDMLKPGGRCGILVPEGFLTNVVNRDVIAMRQNLLCNHRLEGVISLPRKIYKPYTISKSSLILLKKQPAAPEHLTFFSCLPEYDGGESEFSDRVYEHDMKQIAEAWKCWKRGLSPGNREAVFWTASMEEIKKKGFLLGADLFRESDYVYTKLQTKKLWERILRGQEKLEHDMEDYFREDSAI